MGTHSFSERFGIFWAYLANRLKVKMSYRADFAFNAASTAVYGLVNIVFLWALFQKTETLGGWTFWEALFLYGFGELTFGLFSMFFFTALRELPIHYIIEGNLDRVMLRPLHPLFQVCLENFNFDEIIVVIKGLGILLFINSRLPEPLRPAELPLFIPMIGGSVLVYAGVFLVFASASFWFKDRRGIFQPLYRLSDYCRYPFEVYPRAIRVVFTWLIPFGFVSYYPSLAFLRSATSTLALLTPLVGASAFIAGLMLFSVGLTRYESTGS